jgi:glycosyltransferase involved in cell wall biosynthesis/SAM-dependent methyltransferase
VKACTIVARNYLAHARVLAESFREQHPDAAFATLVIDAQPSELEGESFEVLRPTQIGIDEAEFGRMAMIYDVLELATAVKPWFLRHLLAEDDVVLYFDPDIEVFAPLDEIETQARAHPIVLTPHTTEAAPRERNALAENAILVAGTYNLGFIGLGAGVETERFLDWWSERVSRECIVDPAQGRFVDQRWVDFVPGLFDVHILRDPSYNVAWWNLANRKLGWTGTRYEVDGRPLRFFHFSGYSPDDPHVLSKHQGPAPPVLLSENPALARICGRYADRLRAAGYREASTLPYGLGSLPNGIPVDRRMRRLYRAELVAAEKEGAPEPPLPFDPRHADRFIEWLNEPVDGAPVSRYLEAVYAARPDVRAAFPDPARGFQEWVRAVGRSEEAIPVPLVPGPTPTKVGTTRWKLARRVGRNTPEADTPAAPVESPPLHDLPSGVNVAGYLRAELGVGEAARHLIAGIRRADLPYTTFTYSATTSRQEHDFDAERAGHPVYDTNIVCVNADQILNFAHDVGRDFFAGRYTIGLWWWEVGYFPEFLHGAFDVVDEVWVGSDFVRRAVSAETSKPVRVLPLGIERRKVEPRSRAQLGLPEGFLFLFSFDFLSVVERKNPLGLVQAFKQAFAPGEGPTLVLKSINGDQKLSALEELRMATADREDILVVDRYLSAAEKNALTATCDAYVSLHRSEGFGLTMAEAMVAGKPVIATGYSGNLMFMNEANSYLVPYRLAPIPAGCEPYPAGIEWAEPDLDAAAALLRHVYEYRDDAHAKGARGCEDIREHHEPGATAAFLTRRLEEIRRERSAQAPAPAPRQGGLERAAEYHASGPRNPISAPSRLRGGRFLRRLLFRVLRPYIVRRQELDEALVDALRELDRELRATRAELDEQLRAARAELAERLDTLAAADRAGDEAARKHLDAASEHLNAIDARLSRLGHELHAQPYVSDLTLLRTTDRDGREAIGFVVDGAGPVEDVYRGFEDIFRGSEEFIRERQRAYLGLVGTREPVLDVGCGRGEFLDLLREAGIEARGVDIDEGMVEYCRRKGHEVELADANDYLERQPDDSLGAIFSAQVIEHMPYEALVRYFALAEAKLAPGGVLIAETVNPHSIAASKAFWVDPSHRNPIFPEVAAALARLTGFTSGLIVFPAGTGELDEDRVTQGEYALVAAKVGSPAHRPKAT